VPRGQRDGSLRPYSRFSRQEPLLFYQVAPRLYSRGLVDPVPDPLLFFLVVPGNRTRDPYICSQELRPLDHRGGRSKSKPNRILLSLFSNLEDGGSMLVRNVGKYLQGCTVSYTRKQYTSWLRVGRVAKKFSVTESKGSVQR
jgi:hypothetical protein